MLQFEFSKFVFILRSSYVNSSNQCDVIFFFSGVGKNLQEETITPYYTSSGKRDLETFQPQNVVVIENRNTDDTD